MNPKNKIIGLFKKSNFFQKSNFIQDSKDAIKNACSLLDRGLAQTVSDNMKEIMEVCDKKKDENDKDLDWVFAIACCLYSYSFFSFGRKIEENYLNKAQEIANKHDFLDIICWINLCKLYSMVISGRMGHFQEIVDLTRSILTTIDDPERYKLKFLPILSRAAINNGDFESAIKNATELIELSCKLKKINFEIQGNNLIGKAFLASNNVEEALRYVNKAISLGIVEKGQEQLIQSFYLKAGILLKKDNVSEAKVYLEDAEKRLSEGLESIDTYYHINIERLSGMLSQKEGDLSKAEGHLNQALKVAQKSESPLEEGISHMNLGELYMNSGNFNKAAISLEEASGKFIIINNQFLLAEANKLRGVLDINKSKLSSAEGADAFAKKPTAASPAQVNALDDFMKIAISNLDLDTVLKNVIEHIMRVTDADRGFIVLINEDGELYSHVMRTKKKTDEKKADFIKKFSRSITERVLKTHESILVNDIKDDQAFATAQSIVGLDIRSAVCVPLLKDINEIIGLIYIDRQAFVGAFTEDDLALLKSLAGYAAIAVSNARVHSGVQKKLENTQEQLIQSEKLATIGTLAGGVAHEINTPLGAILNNAEMLMMDPLNEDQKESLELIKQSTLKCKTIVEQLLKYSRKTNLETENANINSIINDACIILEHQFNNSGIDIEKNFSDLNDFSCNSTEISQVITNLLINARDAIVERKITPGNLGLIKINTFLDNNMVIVDIIDNGIGISEENIKKIYDPFFTTKEVGKGTGLGLSIVQKIIDRHGGRIDIKSEVGKGTTISLKFIL